MVGGNIHVDGSVDQGWLSTSLLSVGGEQLSNLCLHGIMDVDDGDDDDSMIGIIMC